MTGIDASLRSRIDALSQAGHLLVALDFDGTLAPFVDRPDDARALPASVRAIRELAQLPNTDVALVSGRSLESLRSVASPGATVLLVGSHGAERHAPEDFGADDASANLSPAQRKTLERARKILGRVADEHPGVWIESKPAGLVLHTRQADAKADATATRQSLGLLDTELPQARVTQGRDVVEVSVLPADKGQGLQWLREVTDASVVLFVGDDRTDEDGFKVLGKKDIGIKVGVGRTAAQYRVDGPGDVSELLDLLVSVRD